MKKINALIPARGGSKGVPRKNIRILNGHPLIAYSIKVCLDSGLIDKVYVSTEDEEIASVAKEYGATVPFIRPQEYAEDTSTDNEVLNHFFDNIDLEEIAFIRPTTPNRETKIIDACIEEYFTNNKSKCSGIRSMHLLPESPYKMYRLDDSGYCTGFFEDFNGEKNYTNLPRQVFPEAYHPNGYIDIIKREMVRQNNTFGEKVLPFVTEFCLEVDTEYEFKMLEIKMKQSLLLAEQ